MDAFVSNASDKDGFLHIDAIETIASTGFATASVKEHVNALFAKLGASNRAEAVAIALRKHLLKI